VVVEETTGGGVTVDVCSVVVVLVIGAGLLQPATRAVPASNVTTVKSRRKGVLVVMA